jgi:hypothetical protein
VWEGSIGVGKVTFCFGEEIAIVVVIFVIFTGIFVGGVAMLLSFIL